MSIRFPFACTLAAAALVSLVSFAGPAAQDETAESDEIEFVPVTRAVCKLQPRSGTQVQGRVSFTQQSDGVLIEAEVTGLTPGKHGFHVHEWGDLDCMDGMCTGGHFDPTRQPHGGPDDKERHAGDFGNLEADEKGVARYRRVDSRIALNGPYSIVGRGLIVHEKEDDLKTQPTGNAGARHAAGVIGIADPGVVTLKKN